MTRATQQQLLRNAARRVGREELAVRLKVPLALLDAWINGHATMTERKLLMLADFLDKLPERR